MWKKVEEDMLLIVKLDFIPYPPKTLALKVFVVDENGDPSCHIGFLPKRLIEIGEGEKYHKKVLIVKRLLLSSDSEDERKMNQYYCGVARCFITTTFEGDI